jgi:hypothetical protein
MDKLVVLILNASLTLAIKEHAYLAQMQEQLLNVMALLVQETLVV